MIVASAVIAVLGATVVWLALELRDVKIQRDNAETQWCRLAGDAGMSDWYAERALVAEARVKELEAQLVAVEGAQQ